MGFAALKQHWEKLKHQGFSAHLSQSLTGHETDPKEETGIEKDRNKSTTWKESSLVSHASVLHKKVVQPPRKACVKIPHLQLYSWTGLDCKAASYNGRDYCYIAVCFSKYAFDCCRNFSNVLPTTISGFSNCKECGNWSKQDILCGGLWIKTLLHRYDSQGAYGRTIMFHSALWWNTECIG